MIRKKRDLPEPTELFVSASPNAVESAMKASREIDEAKLKKLLRDINS